MAHSCDKERIKVSKQKAQKTALINLFRGRAMHCTPARYRGINFNPHLARTMIGVGQPWPILSAARDNRHLFRLRYHTWRDTST